MRYILILGAGLIVLAGLVAASTVTVTERDYVVLTQFGKPVKTIHEPGIYPKRPLCLETVNRIDRRIHVFTTQPIQLLLGDKNPIVITCYICWRVHDPLLFFQSLISTETATQKLGDMVNSQLGNVLGEYRLENIINTDPAKVQLAAIESLILGNANERAVEKYGIEVVHVGMRRIAYPTIVADAVYNRMRSEREKEAKKIRAEGQQEATTLKAKTDREVAEIGAEAYRKAEILKGQGDQQALKIYAEACAQDKEFFEFVKSMDVYKDILNQKSTLILSTDSELFHYLKDPRGRP